MVTASRSRIRNSREKYAYRKENNLCTQCGKEKDREGALCKVCCKKRSKYFGIYKISVKKQLIK